MKFRNPETGEVLSIRNGIYIFCKMRENCFRCPLEDVDESLDCEKWIEYHPHEAARLMGYEIIEDDCDQTATDSNQEAKSDGGKPRPSLVPPALIRADMATREFGCAKYHDPDNWRNVEASRYWDALLRHVLAAWDDWQAVDPESGLPHLHHIICNAGFLAQYMEEEQDGKDNQG